MSGGKSSDDLSQKIIGLCYFNEKSNELIKEKADAITEKI